MKKLSSSGFGVIEGLLIVVIIGVIGGVGFYVYNANKNTNESLNNTGNSEITKAERQENDQAQAKQDDIFEIKELGVKFALNENLKGLYYYLGNNGRTAYFSLEELKSTDCAADKTAQIALTRHTEEDFSSDPIVASLKEEAKQFGKYYYFAIGGQAACSEDGVIQEKASKLRTEIAKLLPEALEQIQ